MPHRVAWRRIRAWLRTPWADLTDRERLLLNRSAKLIALPMALVTVAALLAALAVAVHDSQARTNSNRALIRQINMDENRLSTVVHQLTTVIDEQSRSRIENRKRFAASDITLCNRIEVVRRQIRDSVKFDPRATEATLKLLKIDPSSRQGQALIKSAKKSAGMLQKRFAPKRCAALPSARASEPQPKPSSKS